MHPNHAVTPDPSSSTMSAYELSLWKALTEHWDNRNNRRGLPNWAGTALERTGAWAREAGDKVVSVVPDQVKEPLRRAGDAVTKVAVQPVIESAVGLLELANDWAAELNDPAAVVRLAARQGHSIENVSDLRNHDAKVCDRLLSLNTLKWRSVGALEGGAMGALALVPVAGVAAAITADIVVIQVLSTALSTRIAYSYGFDATDPGERDFVQRLVRRSLLAQVAKAEPLRDVSRAAQAVKGRVNWSQQLRDNHKLLAALEKLMKQLGPAGARVPVKNVAKVVPLVGIVIGAGTNAVTLGNVAAEAQRFYQTRFLCEKYGLPLPTALSHLAIDSV